MIISAPDFISNATRIVVASRGIQELLIHEETNPEIIGTNPQEEDAITKREVPAR